ncbi:hypothetical protein DFP73DRAFT_532511 [Morchella snyderi]|nr:hypothetical protein DFP73DRAFT_532511 [Morchella snyderi]
MSSYNKNTRSQHFRLPDSLNTAGSRDDATWDEGTPELHQSIEQYATLWNPHSGLKFQFIKEGPAHVRVAINDGDKLSDSDLGLECLENENQETCTMHLRFPVGMPETDIRGTTLHEFGHVLGFVHEHQTPKAKISWNLENLQAFTGLKELEIATNYTHVVRNVTQGHYNPTSIMHYQLFEHTAGKNDDGSVRFTEKPTTLSPGDIQAVRALYPLPPAPSVD